MNEQREIKRYRVEVRDPVTGDERIFGWLPAPSEEAVAHQAKVQFLRSPFEDERYARLETEIVEIPQG